jgi:hypothetical protein
MNKPSAARQKAIMAYIQRAIEEDMPKCRNCGKVATCFGSYESINDWGFACDDCCGHGNEDGTCWQLSELWENLPKVFNERAERPQPQEWSWNKIGEETVIFCVALEPEETNAVIAAIQHDDGTIAKTIVDAHNRSILKP